MEKLYHFAQPLKKYLVEACLILIALVVIITSVGIYIVNVNAVSKEPAHKSSYTKAFVPSPEDNPPDVEEVVDITGAVVKPDSYKLPQSARLKDALVKAGGLSELADKDFFYRNFNLASVLTDQEKIYIPSISEVDSGIFKENYRVVDLNLSPEPTASESQGDQASSKIHINSATPEDLDSLPGVGTTIAQKIVDNRPYTQLDQLVSKKALGSAAFEKLKNLIDL